MAGNIFGTTPQKPGNQNTAGIIALLKTDQELRQTFRSKGLDVNAIIKTLEPGGLAALPSATGSGAIAPAPAAQPPSSGQQTSGGQLSTPEIDTNLQILLSSIPIADPGNIITSEYHNALRDAVRAIASRIGLSVNPVAEFKVLTFSPYFVPSASGRIASPPVSPTNRWEVFYDKASIPLANFDVKQPVSGGFVVQLPDNADIFEMIVRGERLEKDKPPPKEFNIKLNRLKFAKTKLPPLTLIDIDLQTVKDGYFEESESVKLSSAELNTITVNASANVAERKSVNNENYLYYVTADWLGTDNNTAKSDIYSIQILCSV
jgi:hypothetical protein